MIYFSTSCAAVGFGIESANIVGYINTAMAQGYVLFVPQFDSVGSEGLDIQAIVPSTAEKGVYLQTFTDGANTDTMYYYVPSGAAGAGWYSSNRGKADQYVSKTFAKGEGFMLYLDKANISLNISGEVSLAAKTLTSVRSGYTLMGNFRPVAYSIQKIVPAASDKGVYLQTFTTGATTDTMYYYVPGGAAGAGWYSSNRGKADQYVTKNFEPGEGFMIYLPTSMNVTFQAAE